jgi:hypothetical protein
MALQKEARLLFVSCGFNCSTSLYTVRNLCLRSSVNFWIEMEVPSRTACINESQCHSPWKASKTWAVQQEGPFEPNVQARKPANMHQCPGEDEHVQNEVQALLSCQDHRGFELRILPASTICEDFSTAWPCLLLQAGQWPTCLYFPFSVEH